MYYVYVLRSSKDGKKYIGISQNIKERLKQHNNGQNTSTKNRRPFKLEFYKLCDNKIEALKLEKRYKKSHNVLIRDMERSVGLWTPG